MAYEFFLSYARSNAGPYLNRFFDDLSDDLRGKLGLSKTAVVGFRDTNDIELGAEWSPAIATALQQSKVMLALASPAYFKSAYCGKEWAFFRERIVAANFSGPRAPLLKPLVWIASDMSALPDLVGEFQMTTGDTDSVLATKGLEYMLKLIGRNRNDYKLLIDRLGDEIVKAGKTHPLPALATQPLLADLPSAFVAPAVVGSVGGGDGGGGVVAAEPIVMPSGPKHVHFIYVAADPHDFGDARTSDPYVDVGAGDWRPFYPADTRRINPLLQQVASRDALAFSSSELAFGDDLIERIEAAWKQRQIVAIVIDPWSIHWDMRRAVPRYLPQLKLLDRRLDCHWCVFVPWNEHDPGIAAKHDEVAEAVRTAFDFHATLMPNPMFYRENIRSATELQTAVAESLTRLKEEIKKRAEVARPVPGGPARPSVSGPSSGA